MKSKLALLGALTLVTLSASAHAATYWDPKDSSENLKSTDIWSGSATNKNWSSDPAGATFANLVSSSNITVFSAGDYNLPSYAVTISSSVTNSSVTIQSGSITFSGVSTANIRVSSGGFTVNSAVSGPIILNSSVALTGVNAALPINNNSSQLLTFNGPLTTTTATTGTTATVGGSGDGGVTFSGTISDGGTLPTVLPLTMVVNSGNNLVYFDGSKTYTGGTTLKSGTTQINSATSLGAETSALTFNGSSSTLKLAADVVTSRPITMTTAGAIDTGGFNLTYTGATSGTGAITKNGAGTLLVNGSIAGGVTVSNGTLGGTDGTVSGAATIQANGTLAPGASIGTLNFGSTLSLAGDSLFEINPDDATTDHAAGISALTYGGTLHVNNLGDPANFADGQAFDLFDSTSVTASTFFSSVDLPALPVGLEWKAFSGAGENDQAFDYLTGQIVVASATPTPEPASLGLLALGAAALLTRRRKV